jgi:hypothetical protein
MAFTVEEGFKVACYGIHGFSNWGLFFFSVQSSAE